MVNSDFPSKSGVKRTWGKRYYYAGCEFTLAEWSKVLGIQRGTLVLRIKKGWPLARVFETPVDVNKGGRERVYTFNGKTATAKKWAEILGLPISTLKSRLSKKSQSIERSFLTPYFQRSDEPIYLSYNGKKMALSEWAVHLGVLEQTLKARVKRGLSPEQILRPKSLIEFNGEKRTLSEWESITGISKQCIWYRLRHGWKIEDALAVPVNKTEAQVLEIDGVTKTISEWARDAKVTEGTIRKRMHIGWSAKEAIFCGPQKSGRVAKRVKYNGEVKTIDEWARQFGLSSSILRGRLARGWPMSKALSVSKPPVSIKIVKVGKRKKWQPSRKGYVFNGEKKSLAEWCRLYDIDIRLVRKRLAAGWTFKCALETPIVCDSPLDVICDM